MTIVFVVFAEVREGIAHDFLAVYSKRMHAQAFIDAQNESLKPCLVIWEIEVDRHPTDSYWTAPRGLASAYHLIAGLPEDALPDGRTAQEALGTPKPDELDRLRARVAELERGRATFMEWLRETVTTRSSDEALADIRRILGISSVSVSADTSTRERLERVLAARGKSEVPPIAGRDIALDLQLVLAAAEALSGNRDRAQAWIDVPLAEYDGLTPRQLVDRGRADTVLAHIAQLQSGSSG